MKELMAYLRSKKRLLLAALVICALLAGSFVLYRLPPEAVLYPVALCVFLGLAFLIADHLRCRSRCRALERLKGQRAAALEELPAAETPCEQAWRELALGLQREVITDKTEAETRYRDMVDYYTVWAHQIKTPIASMKLTLQNEDSALARRLNSDLFRTEQYVEMVMAFLRLEPGSTDYVFREHTLDALIRPSLRKFSSEFISRKLTLDYQPSALRLVTDEKWFAFVLEQLLSNALKYTRKGHIRIDTAGSELRISDTGIGIAAEDLPRIFEKGYTGLNGRTDRSASGLGLYLCHRICGNLGIPIRIESEAGTGTTVFLNVAQRRVGAE